MRNGTPSSDTPHVCRYLEQIVWSSWSRSGAMAERLARRIPQCEVCGREQPGFQRRPPVMREVRAKILEAPPPVDAAGLVIAKALARLAMGREGLLPTGRFFPDLARRRGIPASLTAQWIDTFLRAGLLTVVWRPGNPPSLIAVTLRHRPALRKLIKSAGKKPSPPQPSSPEREEGEGQEEE